MQQLLTIHADIKKTSNLTIRLCQRLRIITAIYIYCLSYAIWRQQISQDDCDSLKKFLNNYLQMPLRDKACKNVNGG